MTAVVVPDTITVAEWTRVELPGVRLSPEDRLLARELSGQSRLAVDELLDGLRIVSRSWVGVVRFSDLEIRVVPKLVGGNEYLLEMVELTSGIDALRRLNAFREVLATGASLLDLIVALLVEECERLIRGGLIADYVEEESELACLRGRFLVARQVLERPGRLDRLLCRYDERETAVPENLLLLAGVEAARRVVRHPVLSRRLGSVVECLHEVCGERHVDLDALRCGISYDRRNEHYKEAHVLAWLVLDGLGLEDPYSSGGPRCFSFLLDMNRLFESFVGVCLERVGEMIGATVRSQHSVGGVIRDEHTRRPYTTIIPDFVVERRRDPGRRMPIDAKYKLYDEKSVATGDLYQGFLYGYVFAAQAADRRALILHPASPDTPGRPPLQLGVRDLDNQQAAAIRVQGIQVDRVIAELRGTAETWELAALGELGRMAEGVEWGLGA